MAHLSINRRQALIGGMSFASWSYATKQSSAAGDRDPRFVFVNLRGAMDGLSLLAPVGDPYYESVRQGLIVPTTGKNRGFALDSMFVLNPNMPNLARLWSQGDAIIFHATATPYRERSHFDGQDVLESGQARAGSNRSGWLNRLLATLEKGRAVTSPQGLALGTQIPLILRGDQKVINWMPPGFRETSDGLAELLLSLYNQTDPILAKVLSQGLNLRQLAGGETDMQSTIVNTMGANIKGARRRFKYAGVAAGKLLARPDGPRIAAMGLSGWDTHQSAGPLDGRLGKLFAALDGTIDGLHSELKEVWHDTVIIIATEFGRTAKMNGSMGTDHGTATTAIAIGGALKGGRIIADWPSLKTAALYEGRDLRPTIDLRSVFKGLIRDHLGVDNRKLEQTVFPDSTSAPPLKGLVS